MLTTLPAETTRWSSTPTLIRETHALCDEYGGVATASLLEGWIDKAERRVWFLFESGQAR
jgi:starvation-inducible DNA-binding protein